MLKPVSFLNRSTPILDKEKHREHDMSVSEMSHDRFLLLVVGSWVVCPVVLAAVL